MDTQSAVAANLELVDRRGGCLYLSPASPRRRRRSLECLARGNLLQGRWRGNENREPASSSTFCQQHQGERERDRGRGCTGQLKGGITNLTEKKDAPSLAQTEADLRQGHSLDTENRTSAGMGSQNLLRATLSCGLKG